MSPRDPRLHSATMDRMRRRRQMMTLIVLGFFGLVCLGVAYLLIRAATVPPEAVGRWIGRVIAGARSGA